ncbi:unnamed protein product [Lactuca saligna]|uniref:Uncharacterized protein n=1 Tax=Lactuca saligna TaxID=75948 RepID=A0AA35VH23_LACSI|nr:unnamed protein product [Lactuca saligna]
MASKILEGYQKLPVTGFHPLIPELKAIISEADKPKKGGQIGGTKGGKKTKGQEGPSTQTQAPKKRKEPPVSINSSDAGADTSRFTTSHISPPISPICQDDPDMIYGDNEDDFS